MPINNTGFISTDVDLNSILIPKDMFAQGGLWNWGDNRYGTLGTNDIIDRSSPIQTVAGSINWKQVSNAYYHTGAIKTDGTLWMWGDNPVGKLGTNDRTSRSSPIQTVSAGTNWKQVSCGGDHTGAIKTDGTLWMWGQNFSGDLGTNDVTYRSSPIQTVSGGNNWKQVSCGGGGHTGAIKTDGTLWMWGENGSGELGVNDQTDRSSPVQTVSGGTNWKQVACGVGNTGAIKTDGTLWMWGDNRYGALGTNDNIDGRLSPIQTVSGGTNWKQVSCGGFHIGAIKTDGTLWMWGTNTNGQLGTNDVTARSSPIQTVSGGTNWKQVACGQYHTGAIKTDGTLWMWGANGQDTVFGKGALGTNDVTHRSSPIQTVAGGTNWKQVACGSGASIACKDDN
jgi:alpha-tubulin suppressor-like RCC1 family protein